MHDYDPMEIATMGMLTDNPMSFATLGWQFSEQDNIDQEFIGGQARIAGGSGKWFRYQPLQSYFDRHSRPPVRLRARGLIRLGLSASTVIIPTKQKLEINWTQVREEDDLLFGTLPNAQIEKLSHEILSINPVAISEDELLLLTTGLITHVKQSDDDDVILLL